ncbi:hypothetical protein BJV77DRAFT_408592 [Russula vinacea]|nr:hypothetical protein BJV77DRAFT_408592 [Russula vinacea]
MADQQWHSQSDRHLFKHLLLSRAYTLISLFVTRYLHTETFHKMRSTALTALFFALLALLSAVAHAAPASPQGAISKRACLVFECRIETNSTSSPGSTNDAAPVIYNVITNLLGLLRNTPGAPQPTAATASESSSAS